MTNRKRFAIVTSHPIQYFCPQYVSFSKNSNLDVKVFFASAMGYKRYVDKNFGQEVVWNNLKLDEFPHVFLNGDAVIPADQDLDAESLNDELDKFKPDILLSYGYFQKVQKRAYKWANLNSVPIVYMTDAENRQDRAWWKKALKSIYLRYYFRKIKYFFTIGDANEEYYQDYGVNPSKFIRMHHHIDIETYQKAYLNKIELRKKIRTKYNISDDDFVISLTGKLVEWKSPEHLIDLLLFLEEKGRKAHVFMLGSGSMLEELKSKAKLLKKNKVFFAGFVDPTELPEYYAASDLYVHAARIEPHSLAISEAVYMGCPAIVSDKCGSYGNDDDVQVGKNGFVYTYGNIKELGEKVLNLLDSPNTVKMFNHYSRELGLKFQERSHKGCIDELLKREKK